MQGEWGCVVVEGVERPERRGWRVVPQTRVLSEESASSGRGHTREKKNMGNTLDCYTKWFFDAFLDE